MFKRIYFFFFTYLAAVVYSQTLLMLWFQKNGISYTGMLLYFFSMHFSVLFIFFILQGQKFNSKFSLLVGVVTSAAGVLSASFVTNVYHVFIVAFFFGLNMAFLWMIYNVLYFKYSGKEEHGFKSGAYFLIGPVVGVLLAPLSGLVVEKLGYNFLFLSSMILYVVPFVFVFYLPSFDFEFETFKAVSKIENRILIFFQGYISILSFDIIPLFTLFFIATPFKLGSFFGYLAIFAALAATLNSRISDRLQKRASFFYIFTTLNILSYIPLFLSKSFFAWQIFSGVNKLTYGLTRPFDLVLILDHAKLDLVSTMLGREVYLNLGRAAMVIVLLIIYYLTSSLWSALIWSSLVAFLYPMIAYYQKIYLTPN